jgi:cyclin-dependent kinase 12/13
VEQLHKIFKLCGSPTEEYWKKSNLPHATIFKPQQPYKRRIRETFKDFPQSALQLIETLLAIDPADRLTATCALRSDVSWLLFLTILTLFMALNNLHFFVTVH